MDLLKWMGITFARFVGLTVFILGVWTFVANAAQIISGGRDGVWWVTTWVLASGLAGAIGAVLFTLSLDGPDRFRTRTTRSVGWALMVLSVLLPTSVRPMLLPVVLISSYTLFWSLPTETPEEEPVTSG